ncbi:DEAD/DEAH box helicase [Rossellomorea vietnamensis]|uniref:DEAD/DEAH box helicase n=1 Tax=Rossellomorea vietnamensis TaxID=218284 RepID=UPI003CFA3B4B
MLKTRLLHVYIEPLENGRFFLYCENDSGFDVGPDDWKGQLFLWHEASFYGTTLQPKELGTRKGIEVNSWDLLLLFADESFSGMIDWHWDELGQKCLAVAPIMYDSIQEGKWIPRFEDMAENGLSFQVPDELWDNFPEEFWQEDIGEESAEEFVSDWYQRSVRQSLSAGSSDQIFTRLKKLEDSTLTPEELHAYFDEEKWSEWVGLTEDETPFTLGLRLTEPLEEHDPWELETILRDKKRSDKAYSLEEDRLPPSYKKHLDTVKEEQNRWMKMLPLLDQGGEIRNSLDEHDAWDFLTVLSEKFLDLDIEILLPAWWQAMKDAQMTVKAKVKNTDSSYRPSFVGLNAMLDFDWRLSMNGVDLSEEDFQNLVNDQRRLIKIRGQWMKLDPAMIRRIQDLMSKAKAEGISIQDMLEQQLVPRDEEEELLQEDDYDPYEFAKIQIDLNRSMKKMIDTLNNSAEVPIVSTPDTFQGELRPYQQQGMSWLLFLRRYGFGACLADDMGLGKTVQLITYLQEVKKVETPKAPALIIAPTSVLGNWQRELEKFAPDLKVKLHYGANRDKGIEFGRGILDMDVVLTSYGLSHLDFEELETVEWNAIALDEAQNIKNANTKQSRAIRKLEGKHHIALTGTPMENRLSELWAIFDFLNHGYLGGFTQFQKKFIVPIEKEENESRVKELQAKIRPFLLRRTKKDPEVELNLPDKIEQKEYCALTSEQASLYEQLIKDTFAQLEALSGFERKGLVLQMLNRLKQLCNHPALYLKEPQPENIEKRSEKMRKLVDIVENVLDSGEACLIFTQYISMGEMIQNVMKEKFGVDVPFLNGSMAKTQRDNLVERFQNGEFPVFLLSLKAGGTGLNLTAANHVVHYDRWWNPAVENQATDRAYRIGQNRFVHVHKMIASGTLEEKIDMMLEKKQALNDEIIQSDQWMTELSDQDLHSLLSLE